MKNIQPATVPTEVRPRAIGWIKTLKAYRAPTVRRSSFELAITILPLLALWAAAVWSTSISYWLTLPICFIAGGFMVRLFLIQHDCSHAAFFKSHKLNDWVGRVIGVFTVTPYDTWKKSHLIHHRNHGNLHERGIGDVHTLTTEEFRAKPFWGRVAYRWYRHPLVMFGLGPAFLFLLHHRLPIGLMTAGPRYWVSTMATNLGMMAIMTAGIWAIGWLPFLVTYLLIICSAATMGVWLFYVQHQFEDAIWDEPQDWQVHEAALYGSSHYDLPIVLRWITANIGIHHVHHLYSKIPFYRLGKVLRDHPELHGVRRMTLLESFRTVRLKLWCPTTRRMVSFQDAAMA
ncbi:MAG: fatty acid desaturase [Pseudomonadota bacterium]